MTPAPLAGAATPAATLAHATRAVPPPGIGGLGRTGLVTARLGFGGYRVDDETPVHRAALTRALLAGVNLVDTSTNYTDGGSERLVGAVVGDLVRAGRLSREALVVVSKIGYAQGRNLALAEARQASGHPFPEMVLYQPGCWHCIHPEFLADQLERSLARLGLLTLDVCLLHNPEYFLADAAHRGRRPVEAVRDEFYRRLTAAFRFFESQVAAGRLRWYGVSSNTVARPADDAEATSLARMLAAAREAGGPGHHFAVLQLPMNLFESAGFTGAGPSAAGPGEAARPALELAHAEGLGVLVNRPLNAIAGRGMVRLADFAPPAAGATDECLAAVAELEVEYRREIAVHVRVRPDSDRPETFLRWADQLAGVRGRVASVTHWEQVAWQVNGLVAQVVRALDEGLGGELAGTWGAWRDRYLATLGRLLDALGAEAAHGSQRQSAAVARAIDPWLPAERREESLSRKALWVLASTPGVSAVLVGMRRPAYVDDATAVLAWPPLADVRPVYAACARLHLPGA